MEERMGLLFLIVLGAIWACHATELANPNQLSSDAANSELNRKPDVCALCEQYSNEALDYLNDKKIQSEIIDTLHNSCSRMHSFNKQCNKMVDYYVPLFFSEIASVQSGEFCKKVKLCPNNPKISSQVQENSCALCRAAVSAILVKLKDPDTQIEIMTALLKACNNMEDLAAKCKSMVFKYGLWTLVNAEKFLKTTDLCTELHVCPESAAVRQEASIVEGIPLLSDS